MNPKTVLAVLDLKRPGEIVETGIRTFESTLAKSRNQMLAKSLAAEVTALHESAIFIHEILGAKGGEMAHV